MGKHTTRTPEIVQAVLDGMAEEGLSLRKSCLDVGVKPSTFLLWVSEDPAIAEQYVRAREAMADVRLDLALDIVHAAPEMIDTPSGPKIDPAFVAWQRLRYDAEKWHMSKLAPKKYGDKLEISGDKESPLAMTLDVSKVSTEALAEIMAAQDAAKSS